MVETGVMECWSNGVMFECSTAPFPAPSLAITQPSFTPILRFPMAAIGVIGGASAFGRDHGGAQWSLRRAERPEGRAVVRFSNALQDLPADTDGRLFGIDLFDFEEPLGIMIAKFTTQPEAAFGNRSDSAPFAITDLKHFRYQSLRRSIAFSLDCASILILNLSPAGLKLTQCHQCTLENVQWLKAGNDDRHLVASADRFVFVTAHDGAHVTRPKKPLDPILR